jgi:hypothetical protein
LNQSFYCIDCAATIEKELTPISSQVFIYEGMSLCRKHFLIRSHSSGYIPPSTLKKVDKKRQEDLKAYEHWLKRVENEKANDIHF